MTVVSVPPPPPALSWGQKFLLGLLRLLAVVPWLWLICFGLLMGSAVFEFGTLPLYDRPDPKALTYLGFLVSPAAALLVVSLAAPFLMMVAAWVGLVFLPVRQVRRTLVFFVLGELLFLLFPLGTVLARLLDSGLTRESINGSLFLLFPLLSLLVVIALAAWEDLLSWRSTRWTAAFVVWGFLLAALGPAAEQLLTWLVD